MTFTKGQTFTLKGTGQITIARVFTRRSGEMAITVTGDARFTMAEDMFAELIRKVAA